MKKISLITCLALSNLVLVAPLVANEKKMELTIYQVMQRVLDRYPSLKIAEMEVFQAEQQKYQIESTLGWMLNSSAGITHDLTALGTPSDRMDVVGSVARKLKSGSTVSVTGGYRYEDSSLSFNPALPNPAHTTRLDLNYRIPLLQGEDNPLYTEGLVTAESANEIAKANLLLTRITLAEKVKDLFYSSAVTQARIENTQQAIIRARKLEDYIDKNIKLGLSEEKDKLQVTAQTNSKLSELSTIRIQWKQQQYSLNRLMLEEGGTNILPLLTTFEKNYNLQDLIHLTSSSHPTIKISEAKLSIAESKIISARDDKKDNFDLVMSVGSRTSDGNSKTGTVSEKDWAGSVNLEYKHLFDDKGVTSKYKQAQLERNIALHNIQKSNNDIRYTVSGLVSEIEEAQLAVKSAYNKLKSESLKLKEAEHRYRNGRANTAQIIQFQNEYSFAELSYQNQKIDLNNRMTALQIISGQFWTDLEIKPMQPMQYGVEK